MKRKSNKTLIKIFKKYQIDIKRDVIDKELYFNKEMK